VVYGWKLILPIFVAVLDDAECVDPEILIAKLQHKTHGVFARL
jgi:hypothetical protein